MALLDTLSGSSTINFAYSTGRQLRNAYAGSAFQAHKVVAGTNQDIGFVSQVVDTASLLTFCSGVNGTIRTMYDQTANGKNAVFSNGFTECPVVTAGALTNPINGLPVAGTGFLTLASAAFPSSNSLFMACAVACNRTISNSVDRYLVSYTATGQSGPFNNVLSCVPLYCGKKGGVAAFRNNVDLSYGNTIHGHGFQATSYWDGTNNAVRVNGLQKASVASSGTFGTGGAVGLLYDVGSTNTKIWVGEIAELIVGQIVAADMLLIEASQFAYWGVQSYAQLASIGTG